MTHDLLFLILLAVITTQLVVVIIQLSHMREDLIKYFRREHPKAKDWRL